MHTQSKTQCVIVISQLFLFHVMLVQWQMQLQMQLVTSFVTS